MKLTLRTLIAFLDGTMSEDDAATMRKKLRDSESIRDLVERIKSVISQPQLPAPKSSTKGMGSNPNYSSEYIDSTLDLERVAEFEKLTIGSDILLAEVAEAHQILANLADVDAGVSGRLRNRLYRITESLYKAGNDEPEMFPVVEDHSSINEEYDDIETPRKKDKADFLLAPPKVIPPITSDPGNAAPPIQVSTTTHEVPNLGDAPPKDDSDNPGAPTNEAREASFELTAKSDFMSNGQGDRDNPKERNPKEQYKSVNPSEAGMNPAKAKQSKSDSSGSTRPQTKLFPVILATACITALVVLIAVSFLNPPGDRVADNQSDQEKQSHISPAENNSATANDDDSSGVDDEERDDSSEEKSSPSSETDAENPDSDDAIDGNADKGNADSVDGAKTDSRSGNTPTENWKQDEGVKPGDDTQKSKQDEAAEKGKDEEVLNLFKDKDYEDGKKSPPSGNPKSGVPAGSKEKAAEEMKPKAPSNLTDTRELMADAAALANGDAVGLMKSAMQPTVRRTNLPEAQWVSLAQEKAVHINDTVVALPGCQSELELLESVRIKLHGYCKIDLKKNEGEILPLIMIRNGLVRFDNLKDPNNTVDVSLGNRTIQVTFVDQNSRFVANSTQKVTSTGMQPVLQVAAVSGRILCKFDGEVISVEENEMLVIEDDKHETVGFKTLPPRLSEKPSTLDISAKEIFFALSLENPVFQVSAEKAKSDTKPYVRKFAACSSLALGNISALIRFLDDDSNKNFWRDAVLLTRELALTDADFRQRLEEFCRNPGESPGGSAGGSNLDPKTLETWQAFLTTVSNQALENGMAAKLVNELENGELWMRVTAIQTLFALTGKTKFFRPEDRVEKRQKWVKVWEKSLEAKEIRISTAFQSSVFE